MQKDKGVLNMKKTFLRRLSAFVTALVMCAMLVPAVSFAAAKKTITGLTLPYVSYTYSGKEVRPDVLYPALWSVTDGTKVLRNGTDYTVSYRNNINVGIAEVTVKGKGSYSGSSLTKTFIVKPAKNKIVKLTTANGAFKLTWEKATDGAVGYQVLYCKTREQLVNATGQSSRAISLDSPVFVHSYTSTDLNDLSENFSKVPKAGETWYVKVRAFYTKDGKSTSTRYGNYSAIQSITTAAGKLLNTRDVLKKACSLLGSTYGFNHKGTTHDYYPDAQALSAAQVKATGGIDCSGLAYWSLLSLGNVTIGHKDPENTLVNDYDQELPLPMNTINYYVHDEETGDAVPFDDFTITVNGTTSDMLLTRSRFNVKGDYNYFEADNGGFIDPGSLVIIYNPTPMPKGYDHLWIYIGKAKGKEGIKKLLKEKYGITVDDKYIRYYADGGDHWRIDSSGREAGTGKYVGVTINNKLNASDEFSGTIAYRISQDY